MNVSAHEIIGRCYYQLVGDFWLVHWFGQNIVVMKSCGYFNLTDMCLEMQVPCWDWLMSVEYEKAREAYLGMGLQVRDMLMKPNVTNLSSLDKDIILGTYYHPIFLMYFMCWTDSK